MIEKNVPIGRRHEHTKMIRCRKCTSTSSIFKIMLETNAKKHAALLSSKSLPDN